MKKLLFIFLCIPFLAEAQVPIPGLSGKNIFKLNVSSLVAKNFHITYERKLTGRVSASLGFRTMGKSTIPFQGPHDASFIGAIHENALSRFRPGHG